MAGGTGSDFGEDDRILQGGQLRINIDGTSYGVESADSQNMHYQA
jgi:hypothetical protein